MTRFPHVYFCGNQPAYSERFLFKEKGQVLKLLSVPRFRESGTLVLLDMTSLESFQIRFKGDDPKVAPAKAQNHAGEVIMVDMSSAASPVGAD